MSDKPYELTQEQALLVILLKLNPTEARAIFEGSDPSWVKPPAPSWTNRDVDGRWN
jgi:hypothetical protein